MLSLPAPGRSASLALAIALVSACAPQTEPPPRLVLDQSACARCSMLISEPAFAAAYRLDGRERLFDDLGCLLAALADEAGSAGAQIWVRDFETGDWLAGGEATFVRSPALHSPMGAGLAAVRDRTAAERLAAHTGGRVVLRFMELVEESDDAG